MIINDPEPMVTITIIIIVSKIIPLTISVMQGYIIDWRGEIFVLTYTCQMHQMLCKND